MTTIQIKTTITPDQLLHALSEMPLQELDAFVLDVLSLRAQREAPHVSHAEAELLGRINRGLPHDLQQRYTELIEKRRQETLTTHEHADLLDLTNQVELLDAARLAALVELAQLRQCSLAELMDQLGIKAPDYV